MQIAKTVELQLKSGQVMTIEMTPTLLERIRTSFGLEPGQEVTDNHVKYYLAISMRNTLTESEDGKIRAA